MSSPETPKNQQIVPPQAKQFDPAEHPVPPAIAAPPAPHQPGGKLPPPKSTKPNDSDAAWKDPKASDYQLPSAFDKPAQPGKLEGETAVAEIVSDDEAKSSKFYKSKWMGRVLAVTIGISATLGLEQVLGPNINYIRMYERPGKPTLMRMYRHGMDKIMVQDKAKNGEYVTLDNYLSTIPDPADRNIEDAEIRKAVKWYDDE